MSTQGTLHEGIPDGKARAVDFEALETAWCRNKRSAQTLHVTIYSMQPRILEWFHPLYVFHSFGCDDCCYAACHCIHSR